MSQDTVGGTSFETPEASSAPARPTAAETTPEPHRPAAHATLGLAIASIGVVYGDIGTSPLYALRESLALEWARDSRSA